MSFLTVLEGLIAGLWLGSYLFTYLVVSPALKSLPLSDAERIRIRSVVGRRYGRLAGPLLLVWLLVLLLQDFESLTLVRLGQLILLMVAVGVHGYYVGSRLQALAERELLEHHVSVTKERAALQRLSACFTPVSLVVSALLAVLTLL